LFSLIRCFSFICFVDSEANHEIQDGCSSDEELDKLAKEDIKKELEWVEEDLKLEGLSLVTCVCVFVYGCVCACVCVCVYLMMRCVLLLFIVIL